MIKNKRNTYFLLGVVIMIWGVILYKMVHTLRPHKAQKTPKTLLKDFSKIPLEDKDTFSLSIHERDPFLGAFQTRQIKKRIKKQPLVRTKEEQQPLIVFSGMITDKKSEEPIFFVTIDGREYLMKINMVKDQVTLVNGNEKAIRIRYRNELKTIAIRS